jgi:hypothetical protein
VYVYLDGNTGLVLVDTDKLNEDRISQDDLWAAAICEAAYLVLVQVKRGFEFSNKLTLHVKILIVAF